MHAREPFEHAEHEAVSGELLTTQEAAAYFRVHPTSIRRWTRAGLLPCVRIGTGTASRRTVRYRLDDLRRLTATLAGTADDASPSARLPDHGRP
ncbi:MAG: helix-turn-helix domain-containing protein [Candidatus Aenigmarchaeota archaeon]|nr:helix-turn-helix domain-containing protein [Candidatus Aenigmarchaeota archaeon]